MATDPCTTPCLLNPGSGEVMARANNVQDTLSHSTQRGIRNADNFDKYLDNLAIHSAYFQETVKGLALLDTAIATDSSENENQKNQQVSDSTKGAEEVSIAEMATTVGNLAAALAPALANSGNGSTQLTLLGLAAALPAAIAAAQKAATAAVTPAPAA